MPKNRGNSTETKGFRGCRLLRAIPVQYQRRCPQAGPPFPAPTPPSKLYLASPVGPSTNISAGRGGRGAHNLPNTTAAEAALVRSTSSLTPRLERVLTDIDTARRRRLVQSGTWRVPSWMPLASFNRGGAGTRPHNPIGGHRQPHPISKPATRDRNRLVPDVVIE